MMKLNLWPANYTEILVTGSYNFINDFYHKFRKTTEAVERYQNHEVQLGYDEFPLAIKKPTFRTSNEVSNEQGEIYHEISSTKKVVTDDRPVHIGGKTSHVCK